MAELIIETLIVIPAFFLWLTVVAVVVRPFGVRLPLGPFSFAKRRSAFQVLTFPQYVMICGVLCFGCGMLVVTSLSRYLEWRYWHGAALTSDSMIRGLLQYPLLSGVSFGLFTYFTEPRTNK
jgi:hypothetical protein